LKYKAKNQRVTGLYAHRRLMVDLAAFWLGHFIPTPKLRHNFAALQNLWFHLFGLQNRCKQPERYVEYGLNWYKK
jgi:hypothetical protein